MAEDFKSRLAAIEAAKADRIKKQEDEKMNAEIGEAQEEAGKENILRDRAHVLETEVVVGLKEAEGQMQDVNNALAKEDNDPEATAAYEGMKVEIQQKIDEINTTGQELSGIKAQIEMLNVKPVKDNVEAPKDLGLSEAENKFNTQKEGFYKKVNETLEKMPDLNTASGIKDADEKVSAVMDEFNDLIENVHGPRAGEVLKDLYEKIGPNALEFVKQLEKMRNKPKNKTDKYGQKNEVYNLKSVIELSRLGDRIDDLDHAAGADCAQYVLEQYVDKFSGKSPKDIRKGLFDPHNNKALYKSLHLVIRRLGNGEELPPQLKETVKALVPILEASDNVPNPPNVRGESSRFLADNFIARWQDTKDDGEKGYSKKVRDALHTL